MWSTADGSSAPSMDAALQEETRKMVNIMVEMERNYITAEYFRTIQVGGAAWDTKPGCKAGWTGQARQAGL